MVKPLYHLHFLRDVIQIGRFSESCLVRLVIQCGSITSLCAGTILGKLLKSSGVPIHLKPDLFSQDKLQLLVKKMDHIFCSLINVLTSYR